MRIQSSLLRGGLLCGLSLGVWLAGIRPAAAEVTLLERDGLSFFTDGRINVFFSQGIGDAFPQPSPNPNVNAAGMPGPAHNVLGLGQPFTAGYDSTQNGANGKYNAERLRSGFLASILAFGIRRRLSETTTIKSYISLWETAETYGRDRVQDSGLSTSKGFDVREGYMDVEAPWGTLTVGRQGGIFGHMSTEIDFMYGHNYGLGLPCVDDFYATCGHIGTGALGPGFAAGFVYSTPDYRGLRLTAGVFDPVRLLGVWERVPYPRPEGTLTYEKAVSQQVRYKLAVEGMYQYMAQLGGMAQPGGTATTSVWGVSGGGRLEIGWLRLGASVFRGRGLGIYVALQNSGSSFNGNTRELRSFTGYYGQAAAVFGRWQLSAGAGRVIDDQLESDKQDPFTSELKQQTGYSGGIYYSVTQYVAVGVDYFRFQTDWWGAPNSTYDDTGAIVLLPGYINPEKQVINFINAGATFHW